VNLRFSITDVSPSLTGSLQLSISLQNFHHGEKTSLLRTEPVAISEKIVFKEFVTVGYEFHLRQTVSISIHHTGIGEIVTQRVRLCHILYPHKRIHVKREDDSTLCTLNTFCEETMTASKSIFIAIQGKSLADLDTFSKSDPFFKLFKNVNGTWKELYQSKVIQDSLDPIWEEFLISSVSLTNGDEDNSLKIEVFDFDSESSSEMIGSTYLSYSQLGTGASFELTAPKSGKPSGYLQVVKFDMVDDKSFVEYMVQGISISLTVAIDFTASNGLFNQETCLHHISESEDNDYQKVIKIIGSVLSEYDSDKKFSLLGFGAEAPWIDDRHLFSLTKTMDNTFVESYDKLIESYKNILNDKSFILSGPTHFSPLLRYQMKICEATGDNLYHVLLIVTDGVMHDLQETVDCLVQASKLPLSVIIVGVGYENFNKLVQLDSDKSMLQDSRGEKALRDVVQFVPFNAHRDHFEVFAQETMAEIPSQIMNYKQIKHLGN
jgi:hypothetical protein